MKEISRFSHIDSLRGIAVLLVIWLHVSEVYINLSASVKENGTFLYDLAWYINSGRIGVIVFFGISGFVLLKSIRGDRKKGSKTFLIRRFFRLYPTFWISVVFGSLIILLMGGEVTVERIIANITMLPLFFNQEMILGLYWTLEVEIIFYLLGLLLFLSGKSEHPIYIFLTSLLFLILFVEFKKLGFIYPEHIGLGLLSFHLSIMFWGALVRQFYDNPERSVIIFNKSITIKLLLQLLTIAILAMPFAHLIKGIKYENFELVQFGLSNIIGIVFFITSALYFKINNKFIAWIGTISYSMYLFHPIIFMSLFFWLKNYAPVFLSELHLSAYITTNIFLSIIFSSFIYYFVEKYNIEIAHKLTSYDK